MVGLHLTHTGSAAGQILCGGSGETIGHAQYVPLHKPEVRAKCCGACLSTWLAFAFDGDPLPWPVDAVDIARLEADIPPSFASDEEVARFRVKLRASCSKATGVQS